MEIKEFLTNKFKDIFHRDPSYFAFAPGRTNLIGEHLDYNNCPVFPFAIDLRISACFSVRDDNVIRIVDADSVHGERTFEVTAEIPPFAAGDWGNYPKAAVQGIISDGKITVPYRGFDAVIYSTVPAAGGMSSSSAFVVLVSLIFSTANGISYSKMELSALTAVAERYVGTQGGGMDQTASINGIAGKVLKIGFSPLSCTPYPVPEGYSFVVADKTSAEFLKMFGVESSIYTEVNADLGVFLNSIVCEKLKLFDNEDFLWGKLKPLYLQAPPVTVSAKANISKS